MRSASSGNSLLYFRMAEVSLSEAFFLTRGKLKRFFRFSVYFRYTLEAGIRQHSLQRCSSGCHQRLHRKFFVTFCPFHRGPRGTCRRPKALFAFIHFVKTWESAFHSPIIKPDAIKSNCLTGETSPEFKIRSHLFCQCRPGSGGELRKTKQPRNRLWDGDLLADKIFPGTRRNQ